MSNLNEKGYGLTISFTDEVVQIYSSNILEMYFIEDIFSVSVVGKAILVDEDSVFERKENFQGTEKINIFYGGNNENVNSRHFYIYSIKLVPENLKDRKPIYEIYFVDESFLLFNKLKFSYSWKNTSASDIIKDLIEQKIQSSYKIDKWEDSKEEFENYFSPYWSLRQNLNYLIPRIRGGHDVSGYLFYTSCNGIGNNFSLNFVTLESLLSGSIVQNTNSISSSNFISSIVEKTTNFGKDIFENSYNILNSNIFVPLNLPNSLSGKNVTKITDQEEQFKNNKFIFSQGSFFDSGEWKNRVLNWKILSIESSNLNNIFGGMYIGYDIENKSHIKKIMKYDEMIEKTTILGNVSLFPSETQLKNSRNKNNFLENIYPQNMLNKIENEKEGFPKEQIITPKNNSVFSILKSSLSPQRKSSNNLNEIDAFDPSLKIKYFNEDNEETLENLFYNSWVKTYCLQQQLEISLLGDETRKIGDLCELIMINFPEWGENIPEDEKMKFNTLNKKWSGKALIKSITHYFSPNKPNYQQKLVLIKNGYEDLSNQDILMKAVKKNVVNDSFGKKGGS